MNTLLTRFPNASLPKESLDDFERELQRLLEEVGADRLTATVERVKEWEIDDYGNERRRKFFPNPNELWGFVPPPKSDELPRGCAVCQWQPWLAVERNGRILATRCECWSNPMLRTPAPHRSEQWVEREQATPEYEKARQKFFRTFREYRGGMDLLAELKKRAVASDEQYDRNRKLVDEVRGKAR